MTVGPWKGTYLRDASPLIAEDMHKSDRLLRTENYVHRLPFYRGENPLIYMAQDAYFLDVQAIKKRMLELNENVNWIPDHYKHGRFGTHVWCSFEFMSGDDTDYEFFSVFLWLRAYKFES